MKNKNRIRVLAMATAVAVLTTAIPTQGMVYASETTGMETVLDETDVVGEGSQTPSGNTKEGVWPELLEESAESASTETDEESAGAVSTETAEESTKPASTETVGKNTEPELLEEDTETELLEESDEIKSTEASEESDGIELLDEETVWETEEPEEEDEIKNAAVSGEIPEEGDVVKKHTVIVEKKNPESANTEGKDTYWKLVWSDEFNDGKLDTTKWGYQVGNGSAYGVAGWGNNELEYYTDGENVTFEDGKLVITAKKNNQHGSEWTSAKLWTQGQEYYDGKTDEPLFAKKYGRIEAKMSLPEGTGLWPAFWMMPLDDVYGGWASSGEIDIMEARGRFTDSVDGTIHFGNSSPNNKNRGGQYDENKTISEAAKNFDFTGEHEYAVEWLPGQMKWYVDDECYFTTSNWYSTAEGNGDNFTYPAPFDQEFFIMLNLAVGGNYDGGRIDETMTEASMKVDYVRVYDLCDDEDGTIHNYAEDEKTVSSTSSSTGGEGLLGEKEIGENYLTGSLKDAHVSVADQDGKATSGDTPNNEGWYLLTGTNGEATVSGLTEDGTDVAKVTVTNPGDNSYSVQFSHQLPLTEGYSYKLSFDAKADTAKNITAQLSDYVYTSFDGSWTKYSDLKTVGVMTDWKSFEFAFDMTELSDEATRLELNLGANGTGNIYFRNVSLVATGKAEAKPDDIEKEPLSNGEHIYNGTFDQGNNKDENNEYTRMRFWSLMGGAAGSVTNDRARSLVLSPGTSADAGIEQKNVQLLPKEEYNLTFDASGSRDITVKIVGNDGTVYHTATVSATKGQKVTFAMPETVSENYGSIQFVIGNTGEAITLDNVSMIRETNKSVDWSSLSFYPMGNYDFSQGGEGWNVFNDGPPYGWVNNGTADNGDPNAYRLDIVEKGLHIDSSIPQDGSAWCVGIKTEGINAVNVSKLINYKLRLKVTDVVIKAEGPVKNKKTLFIQMPDGSTKTCTITPGDNDEIVIPFTSKSDIEGGQILLQLGANSATEYGKVEFILEYLDFAVDVENNDKNGIPEEYKKLRAPEISSVSTVELGNKVVIKHNDDKWAANIRKVFVNGAEIDLSKISTVTDKVMIAPDVFPETGSYEIRFEVDGYLDGETITQKVVEPQKDPVKNGTFENDIEGWETYVADWNGPVGTFDAVNGEAVISVNSTETHNWDNQFKQTGITLNTSGNYILSFDAYATKERPIELELGNLGTASKRVVNITTKKQTYSILLSGVPETTEGSILFMMGNVDGCLADFGNFGAHKIYLDNVSLKLWSQEDEEALIAPELSVKYTPVLGENVVFFYTQDNQTWEQKEFTVTIDGTAVASDKVKNDMAANTITLDSSLFRTAKHYTVSIAAEGYKAQTFTFYVASDSKNLLPAEWGTVYDGKNDGETGTIATKPYGFDVVFDKTIIDQWGGPMFWSMQAKIDNILTIEKTAYVLSFDAELAYKDASVTADRGLTVEFGAQSNQETIAIHPGKAHYECEVYPGYNEAYYILFMAGGAEKDTAAHTLEVSNIKFAKSADVTTPSIPGTETGTGTNSGGETGTGAGTNPGGEAGTGTGNNPGGETGTGAETNPGGETGTGTGNNPGEETGTGAETNPGEGTGTGTGTSEGSEPESITGITLNMTSVTLAKGKTTTLKATVTPENVSDKALIWKSSKTAVATVEQSGKVKAVGKGTATITVTTADGSLSASCKVTVNIPSTKVKLNTKKVYVVKGKSVNVKAIMTPFDSTDKVTWSTSNKKVATVKNGKIKAKKTGTAKITAKTTSGKKATLKVYVVSKATKSTSIKLNKKNLSIKKGATYNLVATVKPATSTDIVKWKSSNKKVATVDAFGTVTGKKKGKATITATTSSGKKYTCKITVK